MAKGDGKPTRHRTRYTNSAEYRQMNEDLLPALREKLGEDLFSRWEKKYENKSEMAKHLSMIRILEGLEV